MAPHANTLAWKIPWMEEPGSLQSMGSRRVGHDWATSFSLFTFMHWRRKWQPTPVFLPVESQGRGSLVGCRLWGCTESDTTEATEQQQQQQSLMNADCYTVSGLDGDSKAIMEFCSPCITGAWQRRNTWQKFNGQINIVVLRVWILNNNN